MAYEAFSGVGEDVGDISFRRFGDDYSSYDSGMDSSARWDSSFRAPEDFNADYLGVDDSAFDEFRGYHGHTAPIYENDDDQQQQQQHLSPGMPAAASATASSSSFTTMKFRSEFSPSEFSQTGLYNTLPGSYSSNHLEARNSFSQQGIGEDRMFGGGMNGGRAVLPPPEEMQEEGHLLRQWKRQNALLLREKERVERDRLQQIRMDADEYKDTHSAKRTMNREMQMKSNRDKERINLANQEHFHNNANKAYWKAVADLVPKELPTSLEPRALQLNERKKEKKPSTFVALPGPKPGKPTDMGRMRQILLKLKHTPPAHMLPTPPQPPNILPIANASKENGHGQATSSMLQEALQQPHQSIATT